MSWKYHMARRLAQIYSLKQAIVPRKSGYRILLYHSVEDQAAEVGDFVIHRDSFALHLAALAALDLRVVDLNPISQRSGTNHVSITFDDGLLNSLTVAAPLLVEHGFPFSVFVISDSVKQRLRRYLSPEQLRELAILPGCRIGSHSKSHKPLTRCSDTQAREELTDSRKYLEDLLGQSVDSVAYPYGDVDMRIRNLAAQAGYQLGVSTHFDVNYADRDPLLLARTDIRGYDSPAVFTQKLRGGWDFYRFRRMDPMLVSGDTER